MIEKWKDIPGYQGRYAVSDLGRVLRKARKASRTERNLPSKIFSPQIATRGGYHIVSLVGGERRTVSVHSLVLLAFSGPRPPRHDINHLNGIKKDNRLCNLEYCTRSENELHKRSVLRLSVGSQMRSAKLKERDIPVIRESAAIGTSRAEIAKRFSVSRRLIGAIVTRARWKHVP